MSTTSLTPTRLTPSKDWTRTDAPTGNLLWRAYLTEAKYESIRMLRSPAFGAPLIALPVVFYLFFGVLIAGGVKDPKVITGLFSGFAVMGVMGPAMFGFGAVLALERDQGLLRLKRALPMPPAANLLARMLMALLFGAIITSVMVACGLSLGHVPMDAGHSLRFALITIAGSVPFCGIGLFVGTVMKGQAAPAVANVVYLAMAYLGGLWFPLPKGAQWILQLSPAFHLNQLSLAAAGAASLGSPMVHVAVLVAVTLVFTVLAVRRLARVG
ncbi:MAG: ABC transporter permease [Acidobacteriia bacterium]|nr:ABC transporter permease [Terriglobia bacterium]